MRHLSYSYCGIIKGKRPIPIIKHVTCKSHGNNFDICTRLPFIMREMAKRKNILWGLSVSLKEHQKQRQIYDHPNSNLKSDHKHGDLVGNSRAKVVSPRKFEEKSSDELQLRRQVSGHYQINQLYTCLTTYPVNSLLADRQISSQTHGHKLLIHQEPGDDKCSILQEM